MKTTPIPVKFDRQGHSCNFFAGFGPTSCHISASSCWRGWRLVCSFAVRWLSAVCLRPVCWGMSLFVVRRIGGGNVVDASFRWGSDGFLFSVYACVWRAGGRSGSILSRGRAMLHFGAFSCRQYLIISPRAQLPGRVGFSPTRGTPARRAGRPPRRARGPPDPPEARPTRQTPARRAGLPPDERDARPNRAVSSVAGGFCDRG